MKKSDKVARSLEDQLISVGADGGTVVALTGAWGVGKTYLWKNMVEPKLAAETPITLSLYGVSSGSELRRKLVNEYYFQKIAKFKKEGKKAFSKKDVVGILADGAFHLLKAVDSKFGTNAVTIEFDPTQFIKEGTVICFDDIERASETLSLPEVFGLANYLAEQKRCRVLLIMHDEVIRRMASESGEQPDSEHSDVVLDDLLERTVRHHVRLEIDIDEALQLFLSEKGLADELALSFEELTVLFSSVFKAGECTNLRTLARTIDGVKYLKSQTEQAIPKAHLKHFVVLNVEKERSKVLHSVDLDFIPGIVLMGNPGAGSAKDPRVEFFHRYYGTEPNDYVFSGPLFDYVVKGVFDSEMFSAEIRPKDPKAMSEWASLIHQVDNDSGFYLSDREVNDWLSKVEALLRSDSPLSTREIFWLIGYSGLLRDRIGGAKNPDLDARITGRLEQKASESDTSFDSIERMRLEALKPFWLPYSVAFDKALDDLELERCFDSVIDAFSRYDVDRIRELLREQPVNTVAAILSDRGLENLSQCFVSQRKAFFQILQSLVDRLDVLASLPKINGNTPQLGLRNYLQKMALSPDNERTDEERFQWFLKNTSHWR